MRETEPAPLAPWSRRRTVTVAGLGAALAAVIVVAAARISAPEPAQFRLLGSWLGLLPARRVGGPVRLVASVVTLVAVAGLVVLWAVSVRATARSRIGVKAAAATCLAWSLPFLIGPPLFSRDVYSFVAQGRLVAAGLDPYRTGPAALGHSALLAAVDPQWRHTLTPYGPVALRVEEFAARAGSSLAAVLTLRALAVLAVAASLLIAIRLAAPRPAAAVIALYGMNPIVLFHLESGAHLEAVMVAAALAGVWLHRRGHPLWGLALVTVAGAVKAPALLAVGTLGWLDLWHAPGRWGKARVLARDGAAALGAFGLCSLLVPDPLGWLRALNTADAARTLATPAVALGHAVGWLLRFSRLDVSTGLGLTLSTAALAAVTLAFIGRLLVTAPRRDLLRTTGFALLAIGVLGPVTHPWYLLWGYAFLMPAAAGGAVRTRRVLLVSSGVMALMEMPGLQGLVAPPVVWIIGLSLTGVVLLATCWREEPAAARLGPLALVRRIPQLVAGA